MLSRRYRVAIRFGREGVHEVHVGTIRDALPQNRFVGLGQPAPTDDRQVLAVVDLAHAPRQQPEALVAAVLRRLLEEQLVAEADAEDRPSLQGQLDHAPPQPTLRELFKGRRKRPHARQDHAIGVIELIGVSRQRRVGSDMEKSAVDRAHVAYTVVDDRDHPSRPLDEGTPGPPPAAIAWRSARPKALNVASATW